jgi:hypothetical protein
MKTKMLVPMDAQSRKLIDWMEKGETCPELIQWLYYCLIMIYEFFVAKTIYVIYFAKSLGCIILVLDIAMISAYILAIKFSNLHGQTAWKL